MSQEKPSIEGSHNINAGGNVTISETNDISLKTQLESLFNQIDARLLSRFGQIEAPTKANDEESFSCQKIMRSLINIGLPHSAAIDVIEGVEHAISNEFDPSKKLSTTDIRRAVQNSIYNLSFSDYGENNLQLWGDNYVRRYGDSNRRLAIINSDDTISLIDYPYLKNSLIPDLINHVYGVKLGSVKKLITPTQIKPMAENILEHVKSLNLCFIRYKTLFALALDLATQPPHPWIANDDTAERVVEYDLERATIHHEKMSKYCGTDKIHQYWHSIDECLYHSCSMMLAYYRMFIGCSPVAPITNLLASLKLNHEGYSSNLWNSSRISQIESDLKSLGYNFQDLVKQLERIIIHRSVKRTKDMSLFSEEVSNFYELSIDLIGHRVEVENFLRKSIYSESTESELLPIIRSTFLKVKGLRIREEDLKMEDNMFWLRHKLNTPVFREIEAKVLVIPVSSSVINDIENYQSYISMKITILETSGEYINSVIFVTFHEDIEMFRELVRLECGKGYRAVVTSVYCLLKINQANEREDMFEDIFTEC
jgi:hypothetical protein